MGRLLRDGKPLIAGAHKVGDVVVLQPDSMMNDAARSFYLEWSKGVKAGKVVIESGRSTFEGEWALEGAWDFDVARADSTKRITLSGPYLGIRIRVVEPIIGGTADVYGVAH